MELYYVISFRNLSLVWQFLVELYKLCRAFHSDSRVLQDCSLYVMVLVVDSNFFLIQFIRFHGHLFEVVISCILLSKNFFLAN